MPDSRKKVVIIFHRIENQPWGAMVKKDMSIALADHPEILAEFVDPRGESDRQIQSLENFLNKGIDALIVCPIDAEKVRPALQAYKKANIPVLVLANDPGDPELYRTLITADHRQFGRAVGSFFVEVMEGNGYLVEITGTPTTSGAVERAAGFREVIADSPGMRIIEQCAGNWLFELARQEFAQILSRRKMIDGVFAHNDEMARGAWEAAKAVNREQEMLITGIDAIHGERGIQMVNQGLLAATFINPSPGKAAIDALVTILAGGACLSRRSLFTSALRSKERIRAWQERRKR